MVPGAPSRSELLGIPATFRLAPRPLRVGTVVSLGVVFRPDRPTPGPSRREYTHVGACFKCWPWFCAQGNPYIHPPARSRDAPSPSPPGPAPAHARLGTRTRAAAQYAPPGGGRRGAWGGGHAASGGDMGGGGRGGMALVRTI